MTKPANGQEGRIAVIGMACRLPGAANYEEFWDNLRNERCSVREIPAERWSKEQFFSPQSEEPNKSVSKWGGFIDDADLFDAMYFGISPREAQCMDPQQRIMLELASSCFEDAGYSQSKISGSRTSVFIGTGNLDHGLRLQDSQQPVSAYWATGVHLSVIPNRISYAFNLNGPSVSVDTACSGSLLALHQGIQSLRYGDATMALIGGCSILTNVTHFTSFSKMGMLSPDGLCRTFDETANGYVRGEGAAFVLIKPEEQALADGDRILGIIIGSAVNHGGHARTLTSPNAFAQARVIIDAHTQANVAPDSISYIEAHGTGTPKGDPIEIVGLKRAFAKLAEQSGVPLTAKSCAIGSAKTNIGHLEPVAGMAGLIKILLSMQHNVLPRLLHFTTLNPRIDLEGSPFYMLDKTEPWMPAKDGNGAPYPRRAGISGFGFGGTNAHVVLEQAAPAAPRAADSLSSHLICLSAKTEEALLQQQSQLAAWLAKEGQEVELRDLSATLLSGREHWAFRLAFQANSIAEAREKLVRSLPAKQAPDQHAVADLFYGVIEPGKSESPPPSKENFPQVFLEKLRRHVGGQEKMDAPEYMAGLGLLAASFSQGHAIDWAAIFTHADARCIALPTYPFARKKYSFLVAQHEEKPPMSEIIPALETARTETPAPAAVPALVSIPRQRIALLTLAEPPGIAVKPFPVADDEFTTHVQPPIRQPLTKVASPSQRKENAQGSEQELQQEMRASLAAALYLEKHEVDVTRSFVEQGLDSVVGVEWMRTLNRSYAINITVTKLYDYPSIVSLAAFIALEIGRQKMPAKMPEHALERKTGAEAVAGNKALAKTNEVSAQHCKIALPSLRATTASAVSYPASSQPEQKDTQQHNQQKTTATESSSESSHVFEAGVSATLREELAQSLAAVLYMDQESIQSDRPFVDLGLDSVVGVEWTRILNKEYGMSMPATRLYDYATIDALATYLAEVQPKKPSSTVTEVATKAIKETVEAAVKNTPPQHTQSTQAVPHPFTSKPPSRPLPARNYGLALTTVQALDEVSVSDWVLPMPAHDEVTIRVHASAINFPDVMCVQGLYPTMPAYPFVPGFEVAGVVSSVGEGVTTFKVGDAVIGLTGRDLGGHASHVNVPMSQLTHKPKAMSFEDACSIPVIFLTVQHAFETAKLAPHEHILIQTATGGCGLAAVQMARLLDCVCYGTSSQPEKLAVLHRIGVEHAINYKSTEFDKEILAISQGRGVDVVLNMLAGDAIQRGLNCLAPFGRYLEIAVHALRTSQKLDLSRLVHNQSVHSIDMRRMMLEKNSSGSASFAALLPLFESGQLMPVVSRIYPVGQIADALRYVTQGKHIGKVVISHTATEMIDCTEQCIQGMIEQRQHCAQAPRYIAKSALPVAAMRDTKPSVHIEETAQERIAVIGMAGQFPQAKNLQEFWRNLSQGKDCIEEIPANRWAVSDYFDGSGKVAQKTVCKWMGALDDVDQFDPLFFNIAPAEARLMDPEQRLFLQNVWHCLEDAGIPASSLAGSKCGVFVGCASGDYGQRLGAERLTAQGLMGGSASILAGRISYFFNLQGPCLSIDTACSSSLAAVAQACDSLVAGTSNLALAGGAYVMAGPSMHIMTSQAGMLSKTGRCHTFDQSADGFVPGEGVGVVLLKRLSDAQRDGDKIVGVIKGWGIKQDGKTNGITAPSVNSQIALEKEIYERFAINPKNISLVEAHGTGTKLGDPIEVEALTQSFGAYTDKTQFCALGSVKANIGHGLTSAGIGGLIKVMLCMEHKKLVPTANYTSLNEHINLADSPFFVNTEYCDWNPSGPTRMAAMSSFGFSGTNVHLVMEEGPLVALSAASEGGQQDSEVIIVLSAKSAEQLKANAQNLEAYLRLHARSQANLRLEDVAYTLQVGRDPMDYRLAFGVSSHEDLLAKLAQYAASTSPIGNHAVQAAAGNKFSNQWVSYFKNDADAQALLRTWMRKKNVAKLAELWSQGLDIDWRQLYDGNFPQRISLPGYAFARESYWVTPAQASPREASHRGTDKLHPLLHRNVSTFAQQSFQSRFTGAEFFLADHRVGDQKVLPGMAHLEMARIAMMQSLNSEEKTAQVLVLQHVMWIRPIVMEHDGTATADVGIALAPEKNGHIGYQIYRSSSLSAAGNAQKQIYSTGSAIFKDAPAAIRLNLAQLRAECDLGNLGADDCYAAFRQVGLHYGPAHRGLVNVLRGDKQAIAELRLPAPLLATQADYGLHPALLDAALQTCIGLLADANGALGKLALPYKLRELHMLAACGSHMWAHVRRADDSEKNSAKNGSTGSTPVDLEMDIDLCDENGLVCVRMRGFSLQMLGGKEPVETNARSTTTTATTTATPAITASEKAEIGLLRCEWQPSELSQDAAQEEADLIERSVLFCEMDQVDKLRVRSRLIEAQCLFLDERKREGVADVMQGDSADGIDIALRFQHYAERVLAEIQRLFRASPAASLLLQVVCATKEERQLCAGLSGMLRAAQLENPRFFGQVIGFDDAAHTGTDTIIDRLQDERLAGDQRIRYLNQQRMVASWHAVAEAEAVFSAAAVPMPWKEHGVYLITGGAGGLGFIFAEEIIQQCPTARLILTGRSALSAAQQNRLQAMQSRQPSGGSVAYRAVDVADPQAVIDLVEHIATDCGQLSGIIHSAGVVRDSFIVQKDITDVAAVLAPKVAGVRNLDAATQSMNLDFFVVFSSLAGVMGNLGQADYAAANAFTDAYVAYRAQLAQRGLRHGKSLSINWPLWAEGGMQVDPASQERIRKTIGLISTAQGKQAFYQALSQADSQIAVTAATPAQLNGIRKQRKLETTNRPLLTERASSASSPSVRSDQEKATAFVVDVMTRVLKIPSEKLNFATPFEKYGVDSIVQATLIQEMETALGELPRTLLFEHATMQELIAFLAENYSEKFSAGVDPVFMPASPTAETNLDTQAEFQSQFQLEPALAPASSSFENKEFRGAILAPRQFKQAENTDIAIIGISGRYPQSGTMEQLWQNLVSGKNCITAAPEDRWTSSWHSNTSPGAEEKLAHSADYFGGFLDHIDRFDRHLFEIASNDVLGMTPELRMFLETVWETLEDAGYSKSRLQAIQNKDEQGNCVGVGVFVGSMYSQYGWSLPSLNDAVMQSNETEWQLANRVSHFFDLRGPSLVVNTACSSSMTAIHLACESLRQHGCAMAIAGGVNLTLDRSKYDKLSAARILDAGAHSKSFGIGDGYVPGEGIGAVLLKPLAAAIRDKDRIEGVIKSSAINHSGGRQKYTVPDPKRQAELIRQSLQQAQIDPATINYVESAANGSPLGDPIEVLALKNAFETFTKQKQFCALGSVKSNLGHLEAASGISQLSKVLLQLKHKTLVPSIHAQPVNPTIKLDNSAFYLQQEIAPWHSLIDPATGAALPRRSMINSFGAGGAYSNVIVEEYVAQAAVVEHFEAAQPGDEVCVFSAMNEASLQRYLGKFVQYLQQSIQNSPAVSIVDVAASLRKINHHLRVRAAIVAASKEELLVKLAALISLMDSTGAVGNGVFFAGNLSDGKLQHPAIARWIAGDAAALDEVAYRIDRPCLSLPKYAFAHDEAFNEAFNSSHRTASTAQRSEDLYRSIFEKISLGTLSEAAAWELVQTAEV